jgi:hypothetical protein
VEGERSRDKQCRKLKKKAQSRNKQLSGAALSTSSEDAAAGMQGQNTPADLQG